MIKTYFKPILLILIGTAVYAFGLVHFNIENNLADGGFTGITLLLYFLFQIKPSVTTILLNIPVLIVGYFLLGKRTFILTIVGTVALSVFLEIFQTYHFDIPLKNDMFLATLLSGLFLGTGLGIVFKAGGTTGGVDILARLAEKFWGISIGKTIFIFDFVIIVLSWIFYLTYKEALYTLIAIFLATQIIDRFQEGFITTRGFIIISKSSNEIAAAISRDINRGITIVHGYGFYTKQPSDIIYCVVEKQQIEELKKIIFAVDEYAFVNIMSIHEVLGEGFTFHNKT